jgi:hypothetical protein
MEARRAAAVGVGPEALASSVVPVSVLDLRSIIRLDIGLGIWIYHR